MRPGEVADGPWTQASSRRSARSTESSFASAWLRGTTAYIGSSSSVRSSTPGGACGAEAAERHREVDVAAEELGERLRRAALGDRHVGVGQSAAQVGDRERDEPGQRRRVGGEPDAVLLAPDQVGDLLLGERQPVERGAGVLDEQRPGRRQLGTPARADDERRADLGLQRGQVLGDGGLGEVERGGRAGQRAVVGDRAQRAQAPQVVHKWSLSSVRKPA